MKPKKNEDESLLKKANIDRLYNEDVPKTKNREKLLKDMYILDRSGQTYTVVTPEIAIELLRNNTVNQRKLNKVAVKLYSRQMERGNWNIGDGTIMFASDKGNLLDGTTRLNAIIKSGEPQPIVFIQNVPEENFITMNIGRNRTAANTLEAIGIKYEPSKQASIAKFLIDFSQNRKSAASTAGGHLDNDITNDRIADFIVGHRTLPMESIIEKATRVASECTKERNYLRSNVLGGFYIMSSLINQNKADEFMRLYITGAISDVNHPMYYLLKVLRKDAEAVKSKLYVTIKASMLVKTWNKFIQGLPYAKFDDMSLVDTKKSKSIIPDMLNENGKNVQEIINNKITDIIKK